MARFRRQKEELSSRRQPHIEPTTKRSVFSYHSGRGGLDTTSSTGGHARGGSTAKSAVSKGWQRQWIRNLPSLVAIVVIIGCLLYVAGLTSGATIIFANGNEATMALRTKDDYRTGAQDILNDSLLNYTKFTINTGKFEEAFRQQFPEVADVAITIPLVSRRPVVNITTAQPRLILVSGNQTFVLDRRGTIIMRAEDLSGDARTNLPVVQDQTGLAVELGQAALSAADVSFMTELVSQLSAKNLQVESIILPARAHEVDIRLAGIPYTVKFSTDTDARQAAGTYFATKGQLEREGVMPTEYIDVRVEGRAYYR